MSETTKALVFKKIPTTAVVPGEHIAVETIPFDPVPPPGGLTVSVLVASFDPYLRGRMRDPSIKSYAPPFLVNTPVYSDGVARVLASNNPDYKPGDLIVGHLPIAERASVTADDIARKEFPQPVARKLTDASGIELGVFVGQLGMPGLTAWSSLYEIGQPKKGETLFVSSAAGAVGQIVGQIAKREGLYVIGSAGSDDKVKWLVEEAGFDAAFNYKTEKPADALNRLAPNGIDIYFDNVGGEQLQAAIDKMNLWGRVIACGMISQYQVAPEDRYPITNLFLVVGKRINIRGFIVADKDFGPKYAEEHLTKMSQWVREGSVKTKLAVTEGIENAAEGLVGVFEGKNFGKAVVKIQD